jgi:hypothetical protein
MKTALLVAVVAACGKGDTRAPASTELVTSAQVEGGQVIVDVKCKGAFTVHYKAMPDIACDEATPAHFAIPATDLGAGTHELQIDGKDKKGAALVAYAEVSVPADVLAAQLVIAGCGGGSGSNVHVRVAGTTSPTSCGLEPTLVTKLKLTAPAGVDVSVGKNKYIAPPSGPTEVDVDLADSLLDMSVDEIVVPKSSVNIPWHVGAGSGQLAIDFDHPYATLAKWLAGVATGAVARPTFTPKTGGLLAIQGTGVMSSNPHKPLREQKLLAIATRGDPKDLGKCGDRKHVGFDAAVDVYDTASWQKVATQTFPMTTGCHEQVTGEDVSNDPDWEAVTRWLAGDVTQPPEMPAAPAKTPKKKPAPGSTSRRRR